MDSEAALPSSAAVPNLLLDDPGLREWVECPAAGDPVEGIISSKFPLAEARNTLLDEHSRYSKGQVLEQQKAFGREVGLVIDLTTGEHCCSAEEWKSIGVQHIRIACNGKDEVPDAVSVNRFVFQAMKFFYENGEGNGMKNKFIVVHGLHGHNRTGFMVVHYLMRIRGGVLIQALQAFAAARPPGIYKQKYIQALFTFYHARGYANFLCPCKPFWRKLDEGETVKDSQNKPATLESSAAILNEDILGDAIPEEYQLEMQKICYWALELPPGQGSMKSPQSVPMPLRRTHLADLFLQKYYRVTWKPTGPRYMLLICRDGCYLIDGSFQFRRVEMRFPRKDASSKGKFKNQHYTLLDGEMVVDTDFDNRLIRRFLVVDILMLNQEHTKNLPYHARYQMIHDEITGPRHEDRANVHYYYDKEPFRVRRKHFYNLSSLKCMIEEFVPRLSHPADGIYLQHWDGPYVSGQHDGSLQWKFVHYLNFFIKIPSAQEEPLVYLTGDDGNLKQVAIEFCKPAESQDREKLSGKVVICGWQSLDKTWKILDTDGGKLTPSLWKEYQEVLDCVKEDVSETLLVEEIANMSKSRLYVARDYLHKA